jgi:hypothetical protein
MNIIRRNKCAITGSADLEYLDQLQDVPVYMGCVESPRSSDIVANMNWLIDRQSGLIQLEGLLPLDVLYPFSHGSGGVGKLWEMHHHAFAKFLLKHSSPSKVFEIGGAHGILSKEFFKLGAKIPWVILEPNPNPVVGCEARFIKGFFDSNFSEAIDFDTVVHSHVFEHVYEPNEFMEYLSKFMSEGKKLIFSLPNLKVMLAKKYTNCINFEHTVFLTEPYIEFLLAKHGFRIDIKEYYMDDHSIFYSALRDPNVIPVCLPNSLYEENKKLYVEYNNYHDILIKNLNDKLEKISGEIFLFGGHIFSQYLILKGLKTSRIKNILDNDTSKHKKRLYGTSLNVVSPKILENLKMPTVILKAGIYNNEIKKDIIDNINSNVIFLE